MKILSEKGVERILMERMGMVMMMGYGLAGCFSCVLDETLGRSLELLQLRYSFSRGQFPIAHFRRVYGLNGDPLRDNGEWGSGRWEGGDEME
jgi:hypothetical protein